MNEALTERSETTIELVILSPVVMQDIEDVVSTGNKNFMMGSASEFVVNYDVRRML